MRFGGLMLSLACAGLCFSAAAEARSFEYGPLLETSIPLGDAGETYASGIGAGMAATFTDSSGVGVGLDFGYRNWPGAPDAEAEFDAMLSRLAGRPITGTQWDMDAFEATGYWRLVLPVRGPVSPWIRAGVASYYLREHMELLGQSLDDAHWEFGYIGGAGIDTRVGDTVKLGLDATYRFLFWRAESGAHFTALTVGAHLLFSAR